MELNLTGDNVLDTKKRISVNYDFSSCKVLDGCLNYRTDHILDSSFKELRSAFREMAVYYGNHFLISRVDLSDLKSIKFEGDGRKLELVGYDEDWFITNYLIECYDKYRSDFLAENKSIQRFVIVPSNESSFKVFDEVKDGKIISWVVMRVCLSGITALNDSNCLKHFTNELFKKITSSPESIKLVNEEVDGINLNSLKIFELEDGIIAYDSSLYKYFFRAYKEGLEKKGALEDEQHGIKNYEIKRNRGYNNENGSK